MADTCAIDRRHGRDGSNPRAVNQTDAAESPDQDRHGRSVVILRKLAAAGAGNALSRALPALGRIELTLSPLWLSDPMLRQRSHAGLKKGEANRALRRAVFFHRQGETRDRTFKNQSFRASGLSLITAAIVHWNTVYLDRVVQRPRAQGTTIPDDLLAHVAPLGWEHIALTGDYVWTDYKTTKFTTYSSPCRLSVRFWTDRVVTRVHSHVGTIRVFAQPTTKART